MGFSSELAAHLRRDLTRLVQELEAFPDEQSLWKVLPGVTNSAGNLTLHLEGNLREFIGRRLGHVAFERNRPAEFSSTGVPVAELMRRIKEVRELVDGVVTAMNEEALAASIPAEVLKVQVSAQQFLIHLYGHLNYHLGQIDYLRRIVSGDTSIELAGL